MNVEKIAGIDIGSNAIRLLIMNVITKRKKGVLFKKSEIIRVPIRLGEDVFTKGFISDKNKGRLIEALNAFSLIMNVYEVKRFRACATSAMREATNGNEIIEEVAKKTGISISIISGKEEAEMIFSTDLNNILKKNKHYLYVDVGGGSTEFTLFSNKQIKHSKSFKIGTVRYLNNRVDFEKTLEEVEVWIKSIIEPNQKIYLIGSGGNINKLFKLSGKELNKPLSKKYLKKQYKLLKDMGFDKRVSDLGLNLDRADVIIPATKIYLNTMKWSNSKKIFVPKIGLADGIVKKMYLG